MFMHDGMTQDFETCLAGALAAMLPQDMVEMQKEDGLMACSLTVM